jgi:hypothetical protein
VEAVAEGLRVKEESKSSGSSCIRGFAMAGVLCRKSVRCKEKKLPREIYGKANWPLVST